MNSTLHPAADALKRFSINDESGQEFTSEVSGVGGRTKIVPPVARSYPDGAGVGDEPKKIREPREP